MAANFRITESRVRGGLQLNLIGDFDGTSGFELIHAIEDKAEKTTRIVVNTTGLRKVLPFGCGIFHSRLGLPRHRRNALTFTGRHAERLAPEGALTIADYRLRIVDLNSYNPKSNGGLFTIAGGFYGNDDHGKNLVGFVLQVGNKAIFRHAGRDK